MDDKRNTAASFAKMTEARRLMDQGYYQESLVLAMDALLQELDNLRGSLQALQAATRLELPPAAAPAREGLPGAESDWLPTVKPRVLH
jgi:hypothetical protein